MKRDRSKYNKVKPPVTYDELISARSRDYLEYIDLKAKLDRWRQHQRRKNRKEANTQRNREWRMKRSSE